MECFAMISAVIYMHHMGTPMFHRKNFYLLWIVGLFFAAGHSSQAAKWEADLSTGKNDVQFLAIARPGGVHIQGKTSDGAKDALQGKLVFEGSAVTGTARYKLGSLDTGIALRTKHMKEKYLETSKWPEAQLRLTTLKLPQALVDGDFVAKDEPFEGELTLREETRPVSGRVAIQRDGDNLQMQFTFPVSLKQYKVPPPAFLGIHVEDEVQVTVNIKTKLTKA